MDYKKIFKTPEVRGKILGLTCFVPDVMMLKLQYWIKTGRRLNIKNPKRFTEKLQWYKLHYKNPRMRQCVDKYAVRDYVKAKGLDKTLVKLYAKYRCVEDVEWQSLPDQFVLKTTNGGGGLNVVVCQDKSKLDTDNIKKKLVCKEYKPRTGGREWAYYNIKPQIIIEELLIDSNNPEAGINDYKFFCYSGKAKYIVVDVDRYTEHKRNIYDTNWNRMNVTSDCPGAEIEIEKPENFEEMIRVAEQLSDEFPYVRVDLYNINGHIYFGELTFYPWSGYVQYSPDEWDFIFGEDFSLKKY